MNWSLCSLRGKDHLFSLADPILGLREQKYNHSRSMNARVLSLRVMGSVMRSTGCVLQY